MFHGGRYGTRGEGRRSRRPCTMTTDLPRVAPLRRRVGAIVYDALLVFGLWLATLLILVIAFNHAVVGPFVQSLLFIEVFVFFAYFWTRRGQTVGMLAWGLHLEAADGHEVRAAHALLRFVGAVASFALLGAGHLWMLIDPHRRTWPDIFSGTQLIYSPKKPA